MPASKLGLDVIRELTLREPTARGRPAHVSAASGLVAAGDRLYVACDDELHLGIFPARGTAPGTARRILPGELPTDPDARKALKPDFEILALLPRSLVSPQGALLALGSGSGPARRLGVLLPLDAAGRIDGTSKAAELPRLFAALDAEFGEVNIEGACVAGDELWLLQRGNDTSRLSALVRVQLADALGALLDVRPDAAAVPILGVDWLDLGTIDGVPLGATDAARLDDGSLVLTAVAEDTANSYSDGPCVGAAVALVGADRRVRRVDRLAQPYKVEGVSASRRSSQAIDLRLVTDPDDPRVPALLLCGILGVP